MTVWRGWTLKLIDPYVRQAHVYEASTAPRIETGEAVSGTGAVAGFKLDLTEVWRCYDID